MELTATAFRKNLFQTLDQALGGEPVAITYRGHRLQLTPVSSTSKLSRAIRRPTFLVDPDSIVDSDQELMKELEAKWAAEDAELWG